MRRARQQAPHILCLSAPTVFLQTGFMPPDAEHLDTILMDGAKAFYQIRMIVPVGDLEHYNDL